MKLTSSSGCATVPKLMHSDPWPECRNISIMRNRITTSGILSLLAALFLTACTTNQHLKGSDGGIQALNMDTSDLADVTTDVLQLIEKTNKEDVLVIFDIDNTILAMEQGLGSDQWYEWQKGLGEQDPCSSKNVGDRFAAQGALYFVSAMRPTQEDAATQVKAVQDLGVAVIALTSRGMNFQLQTFRELRRNNFSFNYSAIGPAGGFDEPFMPVENGRLSLYEDGVFLTAGQHKGQMLYALMEKTATRMPVVIVMADDKQKNLDAVKETFSALNIPVHAWHYTGEDMNVRGFDPDQAYAQWESIEEALRQIQRVLGPDNYDLSGAVLPVECDQPVSSPPVAGD